MRPESRDGFRIAIICALSLEADAVEALFDETYDKFGQVYGKQPGDHNVYMTGRIGQENIVLCYLPGMGKGSAAAVTANLRVSFTRVQLALLVGICGGVPFPSNRNDEEIILGDVIISDCVIEYDFGRQYPNGFRRKTGVKDLLGRPNQEVRSLLVALNGRKTRNEIHEGMIQHLQTLQSQPDTPWQYPGVARDVLFEACYRHRHQSRDPRHMCLCLSCMSHSDPVCEEAVNQDCTALGCAGKTLGRSRHATEEPPLPLVYIGAIGSADVVMKSGEHRDLIAAKEGIIAFEMEGAGVWDNMSCIIIKGVCDYADSHKNNVWQNYAAATAAAAVKSILGLWSPTSPSKSNTTLPDCDTIKPVYSEDSRPSMEAEDEQKKVKNNVLRNNNELNTPGYESVHKVIKQESQQGYTKESHEYQATLASPHYEVFVHGPSENQVAVTVSPQNQPGKSLDPDTLDRVTAMYKKGTSLYYQGKYHDAKKVYQDTIQLCERMLGPEHPETIKSVLGVADCFYSQGKHQDAEKLYQLTLQFYELSLGAEHPDILSCMYGMAVSLHCQGKYQDAEQKHRQTLQLRERILGLEHLDTVRSMRGIAVSLHSQERYQDAEKFFQQTLRLRERILGPEHPATIKSILNVADCLYHQRKDQDAERLYRQTIQLSKRILGPLHPDTLSSIHGVARSLDGQGQYKEAEKLFKDILPLRERVLGPEHPNTISTMVGLATCLHSQGRHFEAKRLRRQALELRETTLGPDHPDTLELRKAVDKAECTCM